ncbi:unnamed protein product, partial [Closterium sp. NIES-53]
FLERSRPLQPGKAPKADKASILCYAMRVLSQLHCPSHTPFPPTHRFLELSRLLKPGAQGNFLIPHAPSPPNTHRFLELSRSLEPGKAPKADKASILCYAMRVLSQLHCPSHTPFPPTHRFLELSRLLKPGAQGNFLIPHAPSPPNTHRFLELSRSLEPGKAPKADKASILCDAVRVLSQLHCPSHTPFPPTH